MPLSGDEFTAAREEVRGDPADGGINKPPRRRHNSFGASATSKPRLPSDFGKGGRGKLSHIRTKSQFGRGPELALSEVERVPVERRQA